METIEVAKEIRKQIIRISLESGTGHISSGLSFTDILAVIFNEFRHLEDGKFDNHFVLSKGHGAIAYYAALKVFDLISDDIFLSYEKNNAKLTTFPTEPYLGGLDFASGSLGHGLGVATGFALNDKIEKSENLTFCILSDGEMQEGSIWEAALFASHHKLSNLIAFIDANKLQAIDHVSNVNDISYGDGFKGLGWSVSEVDGHDLSQIKQAITGRSVDKPNLIVANTIKGKGVSYMENSLKWHYLGLKDEFSDKAKAEVGLK